MGYGTAYIAFGRPFFPEVNYMRYCAPAQRVLFVAYKIIFFLFFSFPFVTVGSSRVVLASFKRFVKRLSLSTHCIWLMPQDSDTVETLKSRVREQMVELLKLCPHYNPAVS